MLMPLFLALCLFDFCVPGRSLLPCGIPSVFSRLFGERHGLFRPIGNRRGLRAVGPAGGKHVVPARVGIQPHVFQGTQIL